MQVTRRKGPVKAANGVRLPSEDILGYAQRNQQGSAAGQQVGDLVQKLPQIMSMFGGGGAAAATGAATTAATTAGATTAAAGGAAGVMGAAGPIGMALAAGSMANGMIKQATTDEDGFAKTNTGSMIARGIGSAVDPIGTIMGGFKNLKRDDLTGFQKFQSFIPGQAANATRKADELAKQKFLTMRRKKNVSQALTDSQEADYAGPVLAAAGAKLPSFSRARKYAFGGGVSGGGVAAAKAPKAAPPAKPAPKPGLAPEVLERRTLEEQSAAQQKDWTTTYINSPMYRKRLIIEQNNGDYKPTRENQLQAYQTQQERTQRVKSGNTHFVEQIAYKPQVYLGLNTLDPNVVKEDPTFASIKNLPVKANDVVVERNLPERYSTSPAHEFSHQSTMATKGLSDFARIGISQRVAPGTNAYLSKPTEIKARMDAVRYQMQQQGIYDANNQEFTLEHLQKARENEAVRGNQNFIELEQIMKGKNGTADENLLWMFNNVASIGKPTTAAGTVYAAEGAKVPKAAPTKRKVGAGLSGKPNHVPATESTGTTQSRPFTGYTQPLPRTPQQMQEARNQIADSQLNDVKQLGNVVATAGKYAFPVIRPFVDGAQMIDGVREYMKKPSEGNAAKAGLNFMGLLVSRRTGLSWPGIMGDMVDVSGQELETDHKKAKPKFRRGGRMPASVIASGRLHSEKHGLDEPNVGTHGVPIIALTDNGTMRVAELERDELTMPHELTVKVEKLAGGGKFLELGTLVQQQLLTNTVPSSRYKKRLGNGGKVTATEQTASDKNMAMLDDNGDVQMWMKGEERIWSREDTREMVTASLDAGDNPVKLARLGRRVRSMMKKQDSRAPQEASA